MLARKNFLQAGLSLKPASQTLVEIPNRSNSQGTYNKMAIPLQKLKFVDHPRYGKVYPVVSLDRRHEYPNVARFSLTALTFSNILTVYSTFFIPIFSAEFSALVANPAVLIPSLFLNYYLYKKHYPLFYMDRSLVTNLFLLSCGRKFVVETREGTSKVITITDVFMTKYLESRYDYRIEF